MDIRGDCFCKSSTDSLYLPYKPYNHRKHIMKTCLTAILASLLLSTTAYAETPTVPRDTSFTAWSTYMKVRKNNPDVELMLPELPAGVKAIENVTYTHFDDTPFGPRDLHVDIFRPDNDSIYPALIMIHGGGWNSGDRSLQVPMAQQIAKAGYVTIPVEYRLIPEALYPAGLHDIKTAVRWARANASKYGIDPDRIAVSGCSAGAQLATLTGVTNGSSRHEGEGMWRDVSSDVQAVVSMDGVATFVSQGNISGCEQYFRERGKLQVGPIWLGGLYDVASENWNEASPVKWITSASAPVCFINSELPRYHDGRDELVSVYKSLGIYSEINPVGAPIHPFWLFRQWAEPTVNYTVAFLDKVFK